MECPRPDISVLVATRNRAHHLERLLSSLEGQSLEGLTFELIVINNGSVDDTQSVLERGRSRFKLVALYEGTAGKSRALNHGLKVAAGDLVVFTDDDVTACPIWLRSLHEAFGEYRSAPVFCGPIIPCFPPGTPKWMPNHVGADFLFGKFTPDLPGGPMPTKILPYGANFAIRSSVRRGMRFRLDLGPSEENGPLFGEDTDFARRVRGESQEIIFVPAARVYHHVKSADIEPSSMLERAFHYGRGSIVSQGKFVLPTVTDLCVEQEFERAGLMNYYLGQLYQLNRLGIRSFDHGLRQALDHLKVSSSLDLLGKSAHLFYLSLPKAEDR